MKKKTVSLLLCTALTVTVLAGCGGNKTSATTAGTNASGKAVASSAVGKTAGATGSLGLTMDPATTYAAPKNTKKTDETLVIAIGAEPTTMYPQSPTGSTMSMTIERVLYDRLVDIDPATSKLIPKLATKWEWVDSLHLRVTLRDDVKAVDGTKLTANDVLYTIQTDKDNDGNISKYFNLSETKVESDTSIVLGLASADNGFMYLLANAEYSIVSKSATEAAGGAKAVVQKPLNGSGKYKFVDWKSGEYIMTERNDDYWDKDYVGYYKNIKFVFIKDSSARMLAVQSGNADIATSIKVNEAQGALNAANVEVKVMGSGMISNITFNTQQEYFKNQKVREAVRYLIDVDALNKAINMGCSTLQSALVSSKHPYYYDVYAKDGKTREVNVQKAKDLLKEAGYPDGFEFTEETIKNAENLMTAIQGMLSQAGIKMNINIVDSAVMVKAKRQGKYSLADANSFGLSYGKNIFQYIDPEQIGITVGGIFYKDPDFAALVKKAETSLDEAEAKKAYEDIQKEIYDKCLMIGMFEQITTSIQKKGLVGGYSILRTDVFDAANVHPAE